MNQKDIDILIVEDDLQVAKDIQIKLQGLGYKVSAIVDNGFDAIDYVERKPLDLVIMDIVLPGGIDGIQTTKAIHQHNNNIPVIYLTAYSDESFLERAKITDPMAYILKPVTDRDLYVAIIVALNQAENQRYKDENSFLNATLVSFADALIVWDTKGKVIRVNTAVLELLAKNEDELVGEDITEVLVLKNIDDQRVVTEELIFTIEKYGSLEGEQLYILNGNADKEKFVQISANRIFDQDHHCFGYVMQIRDESQRHQYETALQESEECFRQLVCNIESIFLLSVLDKRQVIYVSPAFETIYGYPAESSVSKEFPFINSVYTADQEKADILIQAIHEKRNCEQTFRIVRANDSVGWVSARCYPVKESKSDKVYRMACIIDDVTENEKSEAKRLQAAKVFENTAEGIMVTDVDLNIVAVNQAFTRITGYSEEEVIGMAAQKLKSNLHDRYFYQNMWGNINNSGHWQGEISTRRKNGETHHQWATINTIYGNDGKIINYVAFISDISSIKTSQQKLDYLVHHDHLTSFANRLLFNVRLEHAIEKAKRDTQKVILLLLDLDHFNAINESMGYAAGDELLKLLSKRLKASLRKQDTLARLGGDEFMFILEDLNSLEKIQLIVQKILKVFDQPFLLDDKDVIFSASIGISIFPDNSDEVPTLIKYADLAKNSAKQQGQTS